MLPFIFTTMAKVSIAYAWSLHTEGSDDGDAAASSSSSSAALQPQPPSGVVSVSLLRHCLDSSAKDMYGTYSFPLGGGDRTGEGLVGSPSALAGSSPYSPSFGHVTVYAPSIPVAVPGFSNAEWLLLVEFETLTASGGRTTVELARQVLSPLGDAAGGSPRRRAAAQGWSGGYLLPLDNTDGAVGGLEMLFVASVAVVTSAASTHPQQQLVNEYVAAFKTCIAHPRWQVVKTQFTTAIDDILLLEERVEAAIQAKDAALLAAVQRQPQHAALVMESEAAAQLKDGTNTAVTADSSPLRSQKQTAAPTGTNQRLEAVETSTISSPQAVLPAGERCAVHGGADATATATASSPQRAGSEREERALRRIIQAKDSEMFILRARIHAMEEARKSELEHLRLQLGRLKLKRVDITAGHGGGTKHTTASAPDETLSSTTIPTAASNRTLSNRRTHQHRDPRGISSSNARTGDDTPAISPTPEDTLVGSSITVPQQRGSAAVTPSSRQASPAARLPTPQRRHIRQVSDYSRLAQSENSAADRSAAGRSNGSAPSSSTQQLDDDRRARLDRLEASFAKLQSRHYAARTTSSTSVYAAIPAVVAVQVPQPQQPPSRTLSPLRVPDSTAALRASSTSRQQPSLSQPQLLDLNSGGEAPQQSMNDTITTSKLSVPILAAAPSASARTPSVVRQNTSTGTTAGSSSLSQRQGSPLLRIAPGTFRAVVDSNEKKPPMHRR